MPKEARSPRAVPEVTPQLLHRETVQRMAGLSRSTLYRWIRSGDFPAPVQIGPRAVRWRASDVDRWIAERSSAGEAA